MFKSSKILLISVLAASLSACATPMKANNSKQQAAPVQKAPEVQAKPMMTEVKSVQAKKANKPVKAQSSKSAVKKGKVYQYNGKNYVLANRSSLHGKASYYAGKFHGRRTANGEIFNMYKMTAAHKTLPLGTVVLVTNLANNRQVVVRINDRGPYIRGRIIDLSKGAAQRVGMIHSGVANVKVEILQAASK